MKKINFLIGILLGFNGLVFSQGSVPTYQNAVGASGAEYASLTGSSNDISKITAFASVTDFDDIAFAKIGTDGSNYLFDNWKNKALIVAGQKKYTINNINYNVRLQRFESQVEDKNSLFIYDLPSISSLTINGKQFISVFNHQTSSNTIYEVIHRDKDREVLKTYDVRVVQGSPNPMLNRKKNKIKKEVNYFIKRGDNLSKIRLGKKSMLKALKTDDDHMARVASYAKENGLSFKKEADLRKILNFSSEL